MAIFSLDGRRIVTASQDRTARLWDVRTGSPIGEPFRGHEDIVEWAAFSPDGRRIVTASEDQTIRIWDVATGRPIGEPLRGHRGRVNSAAFSSDGRLIVSAGEDATVRLWDAEIGNAIGESLAGHEDAVISAMFSPDGKQLVTASRDGTARLWNVMADPRRVALKGYSSDVRNVAFSPDGKRIVTMSDNTAQQWNAETGEPIGEPLTSETEAAGVAFSPNGEAILITFANQAQLWDAQTSTRIGPALTGRAGEGIRNPTFAPDARHIVVAFSPDGRRIVTTSEDNTIQIWDAKTSTPIGEPLRGHEGPMNSAAFSADGKRIVSASEDKTVRLWDAQTGKAIGEPFRLDDAVGAAVFSPNGKLVVTDAISILDIETGKSCQVRPTGSAAFSPNGDRLVSATQFLGVQLWETANCKPIGDPIRPHGEWAGDAVFSSNGRRILIAGRDNFFARLVDGETAIPVAQPFGEDKYFQSIAAFSPDGRQIVTASSSGTDSEIRQFVWIWTVFPTTEEYVWSAKQSVPRCLSNPLRKRFFLSTQPPAWCIELGKWPYHTKAWKQWLVFSRAKLDPPLPATAEWKSFLTAHQGDSTLLKP